MTRTKLSVVALAGLCLIAGLVVSSAGQGAQQPNLRQKGVLLDFNVSGTIGWKTGTGWVDVSNKNCSDLRVIISEKTGTKSVPGGIPIDQFKTIGYVYPTAIANSTDCSYRAKLPVGMPRYLSVDRPSQAGPIGYPEGWQNPITMKAGEKLVRDFKMGVPEIH